MTTPTAIGMLLYVPNIIGYIRIILSIFSFYIAFSDPFIFGICYVTSFLLDAADGHYARKLNQCSKFGAVLDMVTDRFSTAGLVTILSHLYPDCKFACIFLTTLDFCSHWIRMYSSIATGSTSHKNVNQKHNWLLRTYYSNRTVLGVMCVGNEFFYAFMYLAYFFPVPAIALPATIAESTQVASISIFAAIAWICFPIFFTKQLINVIQLCSSSLELVNYEIAQIQEEQTATKKAGSKKAE